MQNGASESADQSISGSHHNNANAPLLLMLCFRTGNEKGQYGGKRDQK